MRLQRFFKSVLALHAPVLHLVLGVGPRHGLPDNQHVGGPPSELRRHVRTRLGRGDVERRRLGRRFQLVARRELEQVPQGPGAEALVLVEEVELLVPRERYTRVPREVHREGRAARFLCADNHQTREAAPRRRRGDEVHALGPGRAPRDAREVRRVLVGQELGPRERRAAARARPAARRRRGDALEALRGRNAVGRPRQRAALRGAPTNARARPALADVRVVRLNRAAAAAPPRSVLAAGRRAPRVRRVARVAEAVALARRAPQRCVGVLCCLCCSVGDQRVQQQRAALHGRRALRFRAVALDL